MSRKFTRIICFILSLSLFTGCASFNKDSAHKTKSSSNAAKTLNSICDELAGHILMSDGITLNYSLSDPASYGINERFASLGEYGTNAFLNEYAYYENMLARLNEVDKKNLSSDDAFTYDVVKKSLSRYQNVDKFLLYEEPLAPVSGIQAQLPVLLAEYHFYNREEIDAYFHIIESVPAYFQSVISYEQEKKAANLFMDSSMADEIITQCRDFINEPENNYLIEVFEDNISDVPGITDSQIKEYSAKNKELITGTLIPAYSELINVLTTLKDGCARGGLCTLPFGKDYYVHLLCDQTGSDKSPKELFSLLENTLHDCRNNIAKAAASDPSVVNRLDNPTYPSDDPETIMQYLTDNITCEFPAPDANMTSYCIKYVHPSLEGTLSPAMYITPPIDTDSTDSIYINNASTDKSSLFPTLAHEGFPGHMYQMRYFMSSSPHPLRLLLNFGGYCEGWATYAELFSYDISGLNSGISAILKNNKLSILCIYSILDIGIHYYSWDKEKVSALLADNGINDPEITDEIYMAVLSEPGLYPKYTVSCIEFLKLREKAEDTLKNKFDACTYHDFILKTGPAWFSLLYDKLDAWIDGQV